MIFVKILGYFVDSGNSFGPDFISFRKNPLYIPILPNLSIRACTSIESIAGNAGYDSLNDSKLYNLGKKLHDQLNNLANDSKCPKFKNEDDLCSFHNADNEIEKCPLVELFSQFYIIVYIPQKRIDGLDDICWCVVHPDEHERMERILNGTDNPLYDLVHELRYNPNMPTHLGVERKEAQEDFEQKKKQKRELE